MFPVLNLYHKKEKLVIGLMSGTSLDGIDAALVKIFNSGKDTKIEMVNFFTMPYPDELVDKLLNISQSCQTTIEEICRLNIVVAEYYLDAIKQLCRRSKVDLARVDLIGSHGQTIQHLPNVESYIGKKIRSTLQIGDPSLLASRTGIVTVANFRNADLALGGQGAPLVPYFDYLIFSSSRLNRILLNIGGIANVTILPKNCRLENVIAFDTGPGNMVIDRLMQILYNQPFDNHGSVAQQGKVSLPLLEKLLAFSYFKKAPPKSTGREEFGDEFVAKVIELGSQIKLPDYDLIATATELTARSIFDGISKGASEFALPDQIIVSGGGMFNRSLMTALRKLFDKTEILTSDELGISGEAKEALCFAVLANETISGNPANLPSVTGASRPAILGAIYCP